MSKPTLPEPTDGTLAARATELSELVSSYAEWRVRDKEIGGLTTRYTELRQLLEKVASLEGSVTILASEPSVADFRRDGVAEVRDRVRSLAERAAGDIKVLLKQRALEDLKAESVLSALHDNSLNAWRQHVLASVDGTGLETVLLRFPRFRGAAQKLALARQQLTLLAQQLPQSTLALAEVQELKRELHDTLESLEGGGLDDTVLNFLRRSGTTGVTLRELLETPQVVRWLEQESLTAAFTIRPT